MMTSVVMAQAEATALQLKIARGCDSSPRPGGDADAEHIETLSRVVVLLVMVMVVVVVVLFLLVGLMLWLCWWLWLVLVVLVVVLLQGGRESRDRDLVAEGTAPEGTAWSRQCAAEPRQSRAAVGVGANEAGRSTAGARCHLPSPLRLCLLCALPSASPNPAPVDDSQCLFGRR